MYVYACTYIICKHLYKIIIHFVILGIKWMQFLIIINM